MSWKSLSEKHRQDQQGAADRQGSLDLQQSGNQAGVRAPSSMRPTSPRCRYLASCSTRVRYGLGGTIPIRDKHLGSDPRFLAPAVTATDVNWNDWYLERQPGTYSVVGNAGSEPANPSFLFDSPVA